MERPAPVLAVAVGLFRGSFHGGWWMPSRWDGATHGKEPTVMSSLAMNCDLVHLGMDTSKDSIVVGILRSGEQVPDIDRVFNDEASVRRLIGRFDDVGV